MSMMEVVSKVLSQNFLRTHLR